MRITALVENQTKCELRSKHGLSLYIETKNHKILFDVGPDNTLFENAKTRGIDLSKVDTVILSHGHMDHGGALNRFLQINSMARVYVQRGAFESHYTKFLFLKVNIGIDKSLARHPQVILVDGDLRIDDELSLLIADRRDQCYSSANDALYAKGEKDDFTHEQNLIISENQTAVIMGCGHSGVVNIMEKAKAYAPKLCVGGFHLFNPMTRKTVPATLLNEIASKLQEYRQTEFYTCHCTGTEAYQVLSQQMPNLHYLSCGETVEA